MSTEVTLPDGPFRFTGHGAEFATPGRPFLSRIAYAAAPVVADPLAENGPGAPAVLDWEATLSLRRRLWAHGFGVAEGMDTAQRGMGLDYPATRELIRRSAWEAQQVGGRIVAGVATDQLPAGPAGLDDIRKAYAEQLHHVQEYATNKLPWDLAFLGFGGLLVLAGMALIRAGRHDTASRGTV